MPINNVLPPLSNGHFNVLFLFATIFLSKLNAQNTVLDPTIENRITQLLAKMTLEEKVGQMTCLKLGMVTEDEVWKSRRWNVIDAKKLKDAIETYHIGTIAGIPTYKLETTESWQSHITTFQQAANKTRLRIPILYGIESMRGANHTKKATIFPHPLGIAATWNTELAHEIAEITAYETRASAIPWVLSPAVEVCRNPLWARMSESFGEDVLLNRRFGREMVEGYQGAAMSGKYRVAACLKYFTGYGATQSGKYATPAYLAERQLREYHLRQYEDAIQAGAMTVMVNQGELNGIPSLVDKNLLTNILKQELNFQGFTVSNFDDINFLHTHHRIAPNLKEAVRMAIEAGLDMAMVKTNFDFSKYVIALVQEQKISLSRIDDAVRRILRVKILLGLFEKTHYPLKDYPNFGAVEHQTKSLQAARESIVLLKNEKMTLPLLKTQRVLLMGPAANNMSTLCGGWAGIDEPIEFFYEEKNTIYEAICAKIGVSRTLLFPADFGKDNDLEDIDKLQLMAQKSDVIVICLGEHAYEGVEGNINDLRLESNQIFLLSIAKKLNKPLVLVLTQGRPRIFGDHTDGISGVMLSIFGGTEGGNAIADVLFGDYNPSGRLPFTYPRHTGNLIPYDHKATENRAVVTTATDEPSFNPLFEFGAGLSYSTISYKNLKINKKDFTKNETLYAEIEITNHSARDVLEVVQLYVRDLYASVTPSVKRLRDFKKVTIKAGETIKVNFALPLKELAFVGLDHKWTLEEGEFEILMKNLSEKFIIK